MHMQMVMRAGVDGTPTWAVAIGLVLLALAGAGVVTRQAVGVRRLDIAGPASAGAAATATAPVQRRATVAPPRTAPTKLPPSDAARTMTAASQAKPVRAPAVAPTPVLSSAPAPRTAAVRQRAGVAAVVVTALASGAVRMLSRHRTGRR